MVFIIPKMQTFSGGDIPSLLFLLDFLGKHFCGRIFLNILRIIIAIWHFIWYK